MKKIFLIIALCFTAKIFASGYVIRGEPIETYPCLPNTKIIHVDFSHSNSSSQALSFVFEEKSLQTVWHQGSKFLQEPNETGGKKYNQPCHQKVSEELTRESFSDQGGLIGSSENNLHLITTQASFCLTSLSFKDTFTLEAAVECPSAIQKIILTKATGINYPLLWGEVDFRKAWPNLLRHKNYFFFTVMGANVSLLIDTHKLPE